MKKSKTIKRDFYFLVVKILFWTILSSILAYICLFIVISVFSNNDFIKRTDYYTNHLERIKEEIEDKGANILTGHLIDIPAIIDEAIEGEVVDISGSHLFGQENLVPQHIDVLQTINQEIVYQNDIYYFVPVQREGAIEGVYVLKAPFSFIKNNSQNPIIIVLYIGLLVSPILFFILYLIFFTRQLYTSLFYNLNKLLAASEKIAEGNFDFKIEGVEKKEFVTIQKSFNTMINALKVMIEDITKLNDERQLMVSSIAHDIRTPVTIIQGQIDLIQKLNNQQYDGLVENYEVILKNCHKLRMLIDNLSLLYKVEHPDFLIQVKPVNITKILMEKEAEIKLMNKHNPTLNISFELSLSKSYYYLDETMFMRVIDNLMANSLQFTREGFIRLEVYDEEPSEGTVLHFTCTDTGTGFKEKNPAKYFEPFYQSDKRKGSTGLGLYISKKIVTNFGGEITAFNNEFGGATVKFSVCELSQYDNSSSVI